MTRSDARFKGGKKKGKGGYFNADNLGGGLFVAIGITIPF